MKNFKSKSVIDYAEGQEQRFSHFPVITVAITDSNGNKRDESNHRLDFYDSEFFDDVFERANHLIRLMIAKKNQEIDEELEDV